MNIKLLSLLLIVALLLSGCAKPSSEQTSVSAPTDDTATTAEPLATENLHTSAKYRIYDTSMCLQAGIVQPSEDDSVEWGRDYIEFSYSSKTRYDNKDAKQERTFTIGGKKYTLNYRDSYRTRLTQSARKELHQLGVGESYYFGSSREGNRVNIDISPETNRILYFDDSSYACEEGDLTQDQAVEIASDLFAELYGEALAREYQPDHISFVDNNSVHHYTIYFTRYICGYRTEDWIYFCIDVQGNLFSLLADNLGTMKHLESSITQEMVINAETALRNSVPSCYEIIDKYLMMDVDGNCYLHCRFSLLNLDPDLPEEILNDRTLLLVINVI